MTTPNWRMHHSDIIRLHREKQMPYHDIADHLKLSEKSVHAFLRRNGFTPIPRPNLRRRRKRGIEPTIYGERKCLACRKTFPTESRFLYMCPGCRAAARRNDWAVI